MKKEEAESFCSSWRTGLVPFMGKLDAIPPGFHASHGEQKNLHTNKLRVAKITILGVPLVRNPRNMVNELCPDIDSWESVRLPDGIV